MDETWTLVVAFLVFAALAWVAAQFGRLEAAVDTTFGPGLLGYRSDDSWPRGTQEEYDVTWWLNGQPDPRPSRTIPAPRPVPYAITILA